MCYLCQSRVLSIHRVFSIFTVCSLYPACDLSINLVFSLSIACSLYPSRVLPIHHVFYLSTVCSLYPPCVLFVFPCLVILPSFPCGKILHFLSPHYYMSQIKAACPFLSIFINGLVCFASLSSSMFVCFVLSMAIVTYSSKTKSSMFQFDRVSE